MRIPRRPLRQASTRPHQVSCVIATIGFASRLPVIDPKSLAFPERKDGAIRRNEPIAAAVWSGSYAATMGLLETGPLAEPNRPAPP